MTRRALALAGFMLISGCTGDSALPTDTGLAGVVMRGPTLPVCLVDDPCEAPFAATFDVYRSGLHVTQFQSDAQGRFTVGLQPGDYQVIPRANAPILDPIGQSKDVTVGADGFTTVTLSFDTGIR